jgi:Mrp family chromosome partitioning ATPase
MGSLSDFDGYATITGPCGDTMDFWIRVRDEIVVEAAFTTDGCGSSRACGSMTTTLAEGKPIGEVMAMTDTTVLEALGDFPESSAHCALLATNTLRAACEEYLRTARTARIGRRILVTSGKGGVGKSTIATLLAVHLREHGLRIGLLDADIHGPSIPAMLGVEDGQPERRDGMIAPVEHGGLKIMSIGFLLPHRDHAVVWRGPRKGAIVQQFFREVDWGDLDALVIDAPPGTGDELLAIAQSSGGVDEAIVVTTPQKISAIDARKAVTFCRDAGIPIAGIVENMNGFACPRCGEVSSILPDGPGKAIAADMDVPWMGSIPVSPDIACSGDVGAPLSLSEADAPITNRLRALFAPVVRRVLEPSPSRDQTA